ncbi:MAG: hypothetical protein QM776_10855 [Rhodocyclaceae bacterium]
MSLTSLAEQISGSAIGTAIAESSLAFPIIEGLHLVGLALSVGLLFITDLRLLNLFLRAVPVEDVLRQLRPWVLGGFALTFITGILLFWAMADVLIANPAFPVKLVFIALAGINALVFEARLGRRVSEWSAQPVYPRGVRIAAATSLASWSVVIIAGRLIPYIR